MGKKLYRSRLETPLDGKALKFLTSLKEDLWISEEDVIGTEVHNIMLFEQKILNEGEISKLLIALENLKEKVLNNQIELDGNYEDIHPLIEKHIIDEIGIHIGGKKHTGRSRNNQISLDLRVKIRKELNRISEELFSPFEILIDFSKNNIHTYVPLYTHLQRGQHIYILLSNLYISWYLIINNGRKRIEPFRVYGNGGRSH